MFVVMPLKVGGGEGRARKSQIKLAQASKAKERTTSDGFVLPRTL